MRSKQFVDRVTLHAKAGNGGHGAVSFRREKFIPKGGPDGGDGGHGGDIILRASPNQDSLLSLFYAPHQKAETGGGGAGSQLHGKSSKSVIVPVPCGTEVWDEDSGLMLADLVDEGDELLAAKGGRGGLGNCHWKSSTHQAPREHTNGKPGEEKTLRLIFKTKADIGLAGLPNAGKSSILSVISHAKPIIAPYPFTTLHPVIGTLIFEDYTMLKLADIPGLIDGAHQGVGLGHSFLRHIERASALIIVVDMAGTDGRDPAEDYQSLVRELTLYKPELLELPLMVVANKMDVPEAAQNLEDFKRITSVEPIEVSATTKDGIDELKAAIRELGVHH